MKYIYLLSLCLLLAISCNDAPKTDTKLIPNSEALAMTKEYDSIKNTITTTKTYNNKEVEFLGSFSISGVILNDKNELLKMGFEGINVLVPVNDSINSAWLPDTEEFLDTKIKIIDNTGKDHIMRAFPVFKIKCNITYDADDKEFIVENKESELYKINQRIKNAGGNNNKKKELNYNAVVTSIEWIGNRDYNN